VSKTGDLRLVGVCGLYCGACYHYRASWPDGEHLLEEAASRSRSREGYACRGCRSDSLYVHPGCAACAIRDCAQEKGLSHCGECSQLPCERLLAFRNDGRLHHLPILEQLGDLARKDPEQWLREQAERWTCACGVAFSWYETSCVRCDSALDSYGVDPTV
jgi:hypothetical protein